MASDAQVRTSAGPSETIKVTLPAELVQRLRAYAQSRNVALSVLIRMMLSAGMESE